jgi:hypothetical protein
MVLVGRTHNAYNGVPVGCLQLAMRARESILCRRLPSVKAASQRFGVVGFQGKTKALGNLSGKYRYVLWIER